MLSLSPLLGRHCTEVALRGGDQALELREVLLEIAQRIERGVEFTEPLVGLLGRVLEMREREGEAVGDAPDGLCVTALLKTERLPEWLEAGINSSLGHALIFALRHL